MKATSSEYLAATRRLHEELDILKHLENKLAEAKVRVDERKDTLYKMDIQQALRDIAVSTDDDEHVLHILDTFYVAVPSDPFKCGGCMGCSFFNSSCEHVKCDAPERKDQLNVIWTKVEP